MEEKILVYKYRQGDVVYPHRFSEDKLLNSKIGWVEYKMGYMIDKPCIILKEGAFPDVAQPVYLLILKGYEEFPGASSTNFWFPEEYLSISKDEPIIYVNNFKEILKNILTQIQWEKVKDQ